MKLIDLFLLFPFQFDDIIQDLKGFSKVIRLIIDHKKPLIGHNCLFDVVRIYHQFVDDLPANYKDFKRAFHAVFPEIYDTKHLAFCSRRALEETDCLGFAGKQ